MSCGHSDARDGWRGDTYRLKLYARVMVRYARETR